MSLGVTRKSVVWLIGPLLLLAVSIAPASAQILTQLGGDARNGVTPAPKPPDPAPSNSPSHSNPDPPSSSDDGNTLEDDAGEALIAVGLVIAPWWVPHQIFDHGFDEPAYFLRYPYWHDESGAMFISQPEGARLRTCQIELGLEYAATFDDLSAVNGHVRLSTTSRFDVETNWSDLTQKTPAGHDQATIGDAEVLFRFAQSEQVQFRSGLGANWLEDHQGLVGGFNFRYGVDVFPIKPWQFTALVDAGELGKAGLIHLRTTGGLCFNRWEIYTGYDYRKIGSVEFDGPVAGVMFRY